LKGDLKKRKPNRPMKETQKKERQKGGKKRGKGKGAISNLKGIRGQATASLKGKGGGGRCSKVKQVRKNTKDENLGKETNKGQKKK